MGLFGYNEKDYNKNSAIFKSRLQNIMEGLMDRDLNALGVGKCLTNLTVLIDRINYCKGKEMESVDQYISTIISDMESDAMKKRVSSILMRAEVLRRELDESRRYGKNALNEEERQAERTRAESLGHIHDALDQLDAIEKRQKKLIDMAASASDSQQQKLELEYNDLEQQKKSLNQQVKMWTSRYNTATKVIQARHTAGSIKELEMAQVGDLHKFEKEMAQATRQLEKQIEIDSNFGSTADDATSAFDNILETGAVNQSSGFYAAVEDRRNEKAMEDAGPAASGQGAQQEGSAFRQAMRNSGN